MKSFSPLYRWYVSPHNRLWQIRRCSALALTFGRDVLRPHLRATDVDHLQYTNLGAEMPIRDILPVHRSTHLMITELRRRGYAKAVNMVLRLAAVLWILAQIAAGVALLKLVHVI